MTHGGKIRPLRKRRGCGIRRIRHTVMAGESDD